MQGCVTSRCSRAHMRNCCWDQQVSSRLELKEVLASRESVQPGEVFHVGEAACTIAASSDVAQHTSATATGVSRATPALCSGKYLLAGYLHSQMGACMSVGLHAGRLIKAIAHAQVHHLHVQHSKRLQLVLGRAGHALGGDLGNLLCRSLLQPDRCVDVRHACLPLP